MDQSAALLSQAGHALLLDCRSGIGTAVPLDPGPAGLGLLVIDTRVRHELTDGGYAARRRACEDAAQALGVRSLRDITDGSQLAGIDPLLAAPGPARRHREQPGAGDRRSCSARAT